jgi:3-oxoacyl-[acyl-carrier-protein] synthase II
MTDRVVVTGIGLVTPVGLDRKTTWDSLLEGKSGIDYISLFDVAALEALEDAGLDMATEDPDRFGVLIGSGVGGIMTITEQHKILLNKGPKRVSPFLVPMMLGDMASGQVSMMIGAKGPNFSTVSACATGTDSIGEALRNRRWDRGCHL